jgi:hypothetical protein
VTALRSLTIAAAEAIAAREGFSPSCPRRPGSWLRVAVRRSGRGSRFRRAIAVPLPPARLSDASADREAPGVWLMRLRRRWKVWCGGRWYALERSVDTSQPYSG